MALLVIRTFELWGEPCWFPIWDDRQVAWMLFDDLWLLAIDCADTETCIFLEDFLSVEVVECLGCVGARDLSKD